MARVALVTGGSRGIGAAISLASARRPGCKVAANYAGNDEAAAKFKGETGIPVFKWDVADAEACKAGIAKVEAELGPVEILVNNAGITRDAAFHRMSLEQWQQVMSTNVDSLFTMTRPVWEGMRAQVRPGDQHQLGQRPEGPVRADQLRGGQGGGIGFTKALAQEGAAVGITVNCICPGYIGTEMVKAVPEDVLKAKILPQIPVGRLGEPEEIARCVVFLASDEAGFITGSTLSANGGQYMA